MGSRRRLRLPGRLTATCLRRTECRNGSTQTTRTELSLGGPSFYCLREALTKQTLSLRLAPSCLRTFLGPERRRYLSNKDRIHARMETWKGGKLIY